MNNERGILVSVLLLGGGLILYFGIQINADLPLDERNPLWALAAGSSFFVLGLLIHQNENIRRWFEGRIEKIAGWFGVSHWQVLLLALSPFFMFLGALGAGYGQRMHSPVLAIASWLLGILLTLVGSCAWNEEKPRISKRTALALAAITVLSFLPRGIGTGYFPVILTGDEGSAGIGAYDFLNGEMNNIFITGWYSFPSFFSFLQSLSIQVFGRTTEALRIPSAVAGALTVAAAYLSGKAMFGERAGRLAALALAALHFHIHFSRLGINNIWDGLGYTLTVGALWYGWAHNKRSAYLLAGLGLGFTQYFYATSRGLFGIVIACMVFAFLFQRARFYQSVPNLVLTFAVTTAVVFPLARYYVREPNQLLAPFARVSSLNDEALESTQDTLGQAAVGLQAYTATHLKHWYKPGTPILRPIFAALFYMGLILLLLQHRDGRLILLTSWLFLFGLIGGLSESAPAAQRYVAAAPACALVVGFGVHQITNIFENLWKNRSRAATVLGYTVIVIAVLSDLNFYFLEYYRMDRIENLDSNGAVAQDLANYLSDKPPGTQVVFLHNPRMGYYSIPSTLYLAPHIEGVDAPQDWESFDQSQLTSKRLIFVSLPDTLDGIERVREDFPGGLLISRKTWDGGILYWLYEHGSN